MIYRLVHFLICCTMAAACGWIVANHTALPDGARVPAGLAVMAALVLFLELSDPNRRRGS